MDNDLISRSAALNILLMSTDYRDAHDMLEQLPAIDAIHYGEWIHITTYSCPYIYCSNCGCIQENAIYYPFCPYCGAKMKENCNV